MDGFLQDEVFLRDDRHTLQLCLKRMCLKQEWGDFMSRMLELGDSEREAAEKLRLREVHIRNCQVIQEKFSS